jgi:hypothetical protein
MNPTNAYTIRRATDADAGALRRLAQLDSQRPITGPALIGDIDGAPAAAVSLADGRVVADPFQPTSSLTELLQMRRRALRTRPRTPSLRKRLRAALAPVNARLIAA